MIRSFPQKIFLPEFFGRVEGGFLQHPPPTMAAVNDGTARVGVGCAVAVVRRSAFRK